MDKEATTTTGRGKDKRIKEMVLRDDRLYRSCLCQHKTDRG